MKSKYRNIDCGEICPVVKTSVSFGELLDLKKSIDKSKKHRPGFDSLKSAKRNKIIGQKHFNQT